MVDLFFVLSGFVISYAYVNRLESYKGIGTFMFLRWGRLYPVHIVFLLIFLVIELAKWTWEIQTGIPARHRAFSANNTQAFMLQLGMLHSVVPIGACTFNCASWSISVEFYIYIVFALVAVMIRPRVIRVMSIIGLIGIAVLMSHSSIKGVWIHPDFLRGVYGFFIGCLSYQGFEVIKSFEKWNSLSLNWAFAFSLTLLLIVMTWPREELQARAFPLVSGVVVLMASLLDRTAIGGLLQHKAFVFLGTISYSLYMAHEAVLWVVSQSLVHLFKYQSRGSSTEVDILTPSLQGVLITVMYVGASLCVANIVYRKVEAPLRAYSRALAKP